jgi:hypothetical protein
MTLMALWLPALPPAPAPVSDASCVPYVQTPPNADKQDQSPDSTGSRQHRDANSTTAGVFELTNGGQQG